jgi:nicotinamidase-related amidase
MSYTLVVVDLQPYFLRKLSSLKVVSSAAKLVKKAVSDKAEIIYLEYNGYGKTTKTINKLTVGYPNKKTLMKSADSGAHVLNKHIKSKKVIFCGINTPYCVYSTVKDFLYYSYIDKNKVIVDLKACDSSVNHEVGVQWFAELKKYNSNLKVIK